MSAHTHTPFPLNGSVLIAPYWADVDTFPSMGGFVHYTVTIVDSVVHAGSESLKFD